MRWRLNQFCNFQVVRVLLTSLVFYNFFKKIKIVQKYRDVAAVKMQMTKTLLPSSPKSNFLRAPEACEPTSAVRAVVSGVESGLFSSFVLLSDLSSVNNIKLISVLRLKTSL